MINPELVNIKTPDQLDPVVLELATQIFAFNPSGEFGGLNLNDLAAFISPYVSSIGSAGYVIVSGNTLPNPVSGQIKYSIVPSGTYTWSGGSLTANGVLNVISSNGTNWVVSVEIPVDSDVILNSDITFKDATASRQLFDKDTIVTTDWTKSGYMVDRNVNSTGGLTTAGTSPGFKVANIPIPVGTTQLTLSGLTSTSAKYYRFIDASGVLIPGEYGALSALTQTLSVPSGAKTLQQSIKRGTAPIDDDTVLGTLMINTGPAAIPWEPFGAVVGSFAEKILGTKFLAGKVQAGAPLGDSDFVAGKSEIPAVAVTEYPLVQGSNQRFNIGNEFNFSSNPLDVTKSGFLRDRIINSSGALAGASGTLYPGWAMINVPRVPGETHLSYSGLNLAAGRYFRFVKADGSLIAGSNGLPSTTSGSLAWPADSVAFQQTIKRDTETDAQTLEKYMLNDGATVKVKDAYVAPSITQLAKTINGKEYAAKALLPGSTMGGKGVATVDQLGTSDKTVTIANIERLMWLGDSYSAMAYQMKGKGYIQILSQFTDWNIENYAKSGDNLNDIFNRMNANTKEFNSAIGIKDINGGGYAVIISYTNEFATDGTGSITIGSPQLDTFLLNLDRVCTAARGLGYKPVICTEFYVGSLYTSPSLAILIQNALRSFCEKHGYMFIDIAAKAMILKGNEFNKFYYGSHPGIRTTAIFGHPFVKHIQSLPRPKTGIKILRLRSSVTVGAISELVSFDENTEFQKFKEIYVGQKPLIDSQEKYYDDLNTLSGLGGATSQTLGEYYKLINKEAVAFASYAKIKCIVNATAANVSYFALYLSDPTVTVYVLNNFTRAWVALTATVVDGVSFFILSDYKTQISYDKVTFLVYKSGGFSLTDVYYKWRGTEGKDLMQKPLLPEMTTAERLTIVNFDASAAGWTATGAPSVITPLDASIPVGANRVALVDATNFYTQAVTFPAETERSREGQIKITARRFPAIFNSGDTYPGVAPINEDTYDLTEIQLDLVLNASNVVSVRKRIWMHWTEILIPFVLPPNQNALTIRIKGVSEQVQVSKASVKIDQ